MGCSGSTQECKPTCPEVNPLAAIPTRPLSRITRIIQEDVVDVFIEDEYDHIESEWEHFHENYQTRELQLLEERGEWRCAESAGGSRNDLELFSMNPQYLLSLGPPEAHPSRDEQLFLDFKYNRQNVSICLTQTSVAVKPFHVAFFVYKTDSQDERLTAEYFLCVPPEGATGAFVNWRQIRQDFRLSPGQYVIIPAIFRAGLEGSFSLTVKSAPPVSLKQLPPYSAAPLRKSSLATLRTSISYESNKDVDTDLQT